MTIMHDRLPPEVSSDWHQIIAKALYARLVHAGALVPGETATLTEAECRLACDAEFEYGLEGESMLFRPAHDVSIPGEHPTRE